MRVSVYALLTDDDIAKIELGRPFVIVNRRGTGSHLKVTSLKTDHRNSYDAHLVELQIGSTKVRVNIEELKQVLRYV